MGKKPNQTKKCSCKAHSTSDLIWAEFSLEKWEDCSINLLPMHFIHVKASLCCFSLFPSWASRYPEVTLVSSLSSGGMLPVCLLLCKPFLLCFFAFSLGRWEPWSLQMQPCRGTGWGVHSVWFGVWGFAAQMFLSLPNASIVSTFLRVYLGVGWSFPWSPLMNIQLPAVGVDS